MKINQLIWVRQLIILALLVTVGCSSPETPSLETQTPTNWADADLSSITPIWPPLAPQLPTLLSAGRTPIPLYTRTPQLTQTLKPTQTSPPPPPFTGRLMVKVGNIVFDIALDDVHGSIVTKKIAAKAFEASVSPDQKNLIFNDEKTTFIQDLQTGAEKPLFEINDAHLECLLWAPDSSKFVYKLSSKPNDAPGLYVYYLSGSKEKIYTPNSADYGIIGLGGGNTHYSEFDCGGWVSNELLLFRGFKGNMPSSITHPFYEELEPNAMYIAAVSEPTRLIPFRENWESYSLCTDEDSYVLVYWSSLYLLDGLSPILLSRCPDCKLPKFMANSCDLFEVKKPEKGNRDLIIYPAGNFDKSKTYSPELCKDDCFWTWDGVFVGAPEENIIALRKYENNGFYLTILDLNTYGFNDIYKFPDEVKFYEQGDEVLTWIP